MPEGSSEDGSTTKGIVVGALSGWALGMPDGIPEDLIEGSLL